MSSFYVLTPPSAGSRKEDTLFVRDGFSWLAFLLPIPWLLYRRLWLLAGLSIALYIVAGFAAEQWGLEALPEAYSLLLSLWVGLEGNHLHATKLEKAGFRLETIVNAHNLDDAEEIYFSELSDEEEYSGPAPSMSPSFRPAPSLALGLIEPYGRR